MRVVVAMSGGVDSSVAAALLKEEGYEVIGITMQVHPSDGPVREGRRFGGCCGLGDVADAQQVARTLGIPHYVASFRDIFERKVIADFCHEYNHGRTPNPCIRCNRFVKLGALLHRARELGAGMVATGHYARIEVDSGSARYLLKKAKDSRKDQTYVLYAMTQDQLRHTLFPLGGMTKREVRETADRLGLPVAGKPESQEVCFIPGNDYARFVEAYTGETARPGPIVDREGNTLGEHRGIAWYTVGQRKRLGVASRQPLYVVRIDKESNTITVGGKGEVYSSELTASGMHWISTERLERPVGVQAKVRYLHEEAEATVAPAGEDEVQVAFEEPQMAITPGQAIVFYEGDTVVGGGTIDRVISGKATVAVNEGRPEMEPEV